MQAREGGCWLPRLKQGQGQGQGLQALETHTCQLTALLQRAPQTQAPAQLMWALAPPMLVLGILSAVA